MALPGVLLLSAFLVAVTGWLVGHVRADLAMADQTEREAQIDALAQAAVQAAALSLSAVADWRPATAIALPIGCPPPSRGVVSVSAADERARAARLVAAGGRWGVDTPVFEPTWVCHAEGVLGRWPERGQLPAVVVMIADDPEGDGRPDVDSNDRLFLRAVVVGAGRTRASASATVARSAVGAPVSLVSFRAE